MSKGWMAALVAVCVAGMVGCGGGKEKAKTTGPEVVVKDMAFKPTKMSVRVGAEVTWTFGDKKVSHNVTASDGSFHSENLTTGTFVHRFDKPGSVAYTCTIHPAQMRGTVEVRA
ncbi:MAG: plastocyanin/azurin family copper-binding protein [Actinomycetota bacterium]|nr:plastocyanin/azurin family copper-binding protein [Actinomycetota bacterium]